MLILAAKLLLAASCLLATSPIPTDELLGGPPCPGACANTCPIMTQDPSYGGGSCVQIVATWTRLQDGCATPTCDQCRQCLGRLRIVITASSECYFNEGGPIKTSWMSQTQEIATPPVGSTTTTGTGTGGLALNPDGSWSSSDVRDLTANCAFSASYSGSTTSGNGSMSTVSASYNCDACSPTEEE